MDSTSRNAERGAPIGVFDSGVGGLTVLRALVARLPSENTIYLGDTARVPYGTRSREVVTRYALLCARHLAARGIKLLVVACNTVSADSLPAIAKALPIPVVGVIEPGAQAAAARTRGAGIAVLGTPATVASGAYQAALARIAPLAKVAARACPLFVPLAEEGWIDGEVPRLTHYPLLAATIAEVVGPELAIVDGAQATAEAVAHLLEVCGLRRSAGVADHRTLCTDVPDRFQKIAERFLGRPVGAVDLVDLTA